MSYSDKPVGLIYNESVSVMKQYNVKRHYDTKHADSVMGKLIGQQRVDKINVLQKYLTKQQVLFTKANMATHISFCCQE